MVHPDALTTENPRTSDGKMPSVVEALKLPRTTSNVYQNLPTMTEHKMHVNIRQFAHMLVSICYNNSNKMAIPFTYHSPERAQAGKGLANYAFSLPLYRSVLVVNGRICSSDETMLAFRSKTSIFTNSFAVFARQGQIEHVLRAKTTHLDKSAKLPGKIMLYFLVNFAVFARRSSNRALFYDYEVILYKIVQYNLHTAKMRSRYISSVKEKECITHFADQAGKFCTISHAFSHSLISCNNSALNMPSTIPTVEVSQ